MSVLENMIKQIRIDTEYGPPIVLDYPFAPNPAAGPSPIGWLKPQITITTNIPGVNPLVSKPWGDPGQTKWPQVQIGLIVAGSIGLGLLGYGIYRALK